MPALNRIYRSRHRRGVLPDNEEGKKAIEYLATTMRTARYSVATRLDRLNEHAPWLNDSQIEMLLYSGHGIVTNAKGKCRPLPDIISGSYLGQHLEVENEERERLKAWWIKPCDMSDEEFEAYKCEKRRKRESNRRRKNGAKSHADSDSRTKPWIDAGFKSRRTWQRHGKPASVGVQNSCVLGINSWAKIPAFESFCRHPAAPRWQGRHHGRAAVASPRRYSDHRQIYSCGRGRCARGDGDGNKIATRSPAKCPASHREKGIGI
jgi:hypothetical protein